MKAKQTLIFKYYKCNVLEQELANYNPKAKSSLPPVLAQPAS